jgi:hypothetical protein
MNTRGWISIAALCSAACGSDAQYTEVVVSVQAEPLVQAMMQSLSIVVKRDPHGANLTVHDNQNVPWKGEYKIALTPGAQGALGLYRVEVAAHRAGDPQPLAVARLLSGYVAGQTRYVRLVLENACLERPSCEPNQTCHQGVCIDATASADGFSSRPDSAKPSVEQAPPTSDAGVVMSGFDGAVPSADASTVVPADATSTPAIEGGSSAPVDSSVRDSGVRDATIGMPAAPSVDALIMKLRACGVVGAGVVVLSADEEDACELSCLDQATCNVLRSAFCDEAEGPLDACIERCELASPQFTCSNGERQPQSYVCDGEDDCVDGSDEATALCAATQFTCRSGERQPQSYVCDGAEDCVDGSDEASALCDATQTRCRDGERLPKSFVCDGEIDCSDGSDELGCAPLLCGDAGV